MSRYFLPDVAPLRETFQLASLIPNIRQPEQDAFPSPKLKAGEDYPALIESVDYRVDQQENLGKLLEVSTNTAFKAQATKILSSAQLFRDLIKHASVRKWLRDEIEYGTKKVYFVVGYFTSLDATTFTGVQQGSKVEVKGTIPVAEIVTHGAATLVSGVTDLDVSGSVKREGGYTTAEGSYMRGERVYAFCYREVKWNIFRLGDKAATLKLHEDNCWALTADNRGQDDREDDEGVQVDLYEDDEGEEGVEDSFDIMGEVSAESDEE
ncbi:hypothetical protein VE02_09054 [Pseudogymnoascus sp. 03VT05]|nr:hypothetical protein VE02_09054 [Pseudogymnoascus sp. 03VT05]